MEIESAESASPVITRLLGSYLVGEQASVFEFARWEKAGLRILNVLPLSLARWAVRLRFRSSALDPEAVMNLTTEDLVASRLRDYDAIRGKKFPAVILGAAMGGASAHLAAVLGVPFLPQPFILGLRGGSPDDDLPVHLETSSPVARAILDRNPDLIGIAHFDPIHDGWLTRTISHLRFKLIDLPAGYRQFIGEVLEPGGTIFYLDSRASWLQYVLGERFRVQVGGWGGISAKEYLQGSQRIDLALNRAGSTHTGGWRLAGLTPLQLPESEWGTEPGFDQAIEQFARDHGYHYHRIVGGDPHDFSRLAFKAHERLYKLYGRSPQGVVVETFTQYDPGLVLRASLLPTWLIFNTTDSLEFLERMTAEFPRDLPVFFSGLVTLSRTPDMVAWDSWVEVLDGFDMRSVGARPQRYPEDLVSLWAWSERLQEQIAFDPLIQQPASLSIDDFLGLIDSIGLHH